MLELEIKGPSDEILDRIVAQEATTGEIRADLRPRCNRISLGVWHSEYPNLLIPLGYSKHDSFRNGWGKISLTTWGNMLVSLELDRDLHNITNEHHRDGFYRDTFIEETIGEGDDRVYREFYPEAVRKLMILELITRQGGLEAQKWSMEKLRPPKPVTKESPPPVAPPPNRRIGRRARHSQA